jgi:hypothetical protein
MPVEALAVVERGSGRMRLQFKRLKEVEERSEGASDSVSETKKHAGSLQKVACFW